MIEDIKVGYYVKPFRTDFKKVKLLSVLKTFRSDHFAPLITPLRQLYTDKEYEIYTINKNKLPAVTFSGTFAPERKAMNIETYNSHIILDVDKVGDDLYDIKETLACDPYVLAVWLSPSGDGLKYLIRSNEPHELHKSVYKGALDYFNDKYQIPIDGSGSDLSRLCFISYDPDIRINEACHLFDQYDPNSVFEEKKSTIPVKKSNSFIFKDMIPNDEVSKNTFKKIYHYLNKRNISITDSHETWVRVAFAISNTFNQVQGLQYFLDLCRLDGDKHDELESEKLINSCYQKGRSQSSFATIIYLAKQKGYDVEFNKKMNKKKPN